MGISIERISRPGRRPLVLPVVGAFAALIAACDPAVESPQSFRGTDISSVPWGRSFELTDHSGGRRSLADFKGKVVLLFFGYTNCPGPCPTALAEMSQVVKQVGPNHVQGLFVTVDPERDTPERLASYVPAFHPSLLGLRGSKEELENVTGEFKIYHRSQKGDDGGHSGHGAQRNPYMVDHSTGIYIFDTQGRPRLYVSASGRSVGDMVHDVNLLLKQ